MKKSIILTILIFLSISSFSQNRVGAVWKIEAYNFPEYLNYKTKINVGIKGEIDTNRFLKNSFVSASAILDIRGYNDDIKKRRESGYDSKRGLDSDIYYLSVPINFGYKIIFNRNFCIYAEAGIFFNKGLSKNTYLDDDYKESYAYAKSVYSENSFREIDYGIGGSFGINMFRHFQASIGSNWGLKPLEVSSSNGKKSKSISLFLNLAFFI